MKTVFYGRQEYVPMWQEMQEFTNTRDDKTPDEIWFVEHPPVFTMGLNASEEHLLEPGDIPVIKTDRGGQVTFHGPGQLMIYPLIDLRRSNMGVRALVTALEQSVVNLAADYDVEAVARPDAPGVYVNREKLASLGLRIRRGSSFHGMALNIAIDLEPFTRINPCGYAELQMTDLHRLGINLGLEDAADEFLPHLLNHLPL
ncbi:MAG: lipoyl(octanoyl) transferase LipB [Pirellulales bacterium]